MGEKEIKEGDQVSWQWSGSRPGGKATEVKQQGEVAIETHRGNTVKKNAEPNNPAVKVERSGNNVVKKASELGVDKAGDKHKEDKGDEKEVSKDEEKNGDSKAGDKRKADKDDDDDDDNSKKNGDDAKKQKKDEPKENGETKKKGGAPKKSGGAAKKETKKKEPKKAATESGEPRRSARHAK